MELKPYRGRLTPTEVVEGSNVALRNAKRLAADARVLFDLKRFATAASLAFLAMEEASKPAILHRIAVAKEDDLKRHWKEYTGHLSKIGSVLLLGPALAGVRELGIDPVRWTP